MDALRARAIKIRPTLANACVAAKRRSRYGRHVKTILAPVDFSGVSDAVVEEAAALARPLQARVVLLAVIQPPALTHEYVALVDNLAELLPAGEKNAQRRLAKFQGDMAEDGIESETVLLSGAPITHILEQAQQWAADYIVMGSHGHTALYDLLVGSTTHGVLLRAKCPVVIVPAAKSSAHVTQNERYAVV